MSLAYWMCVAVTSLSALTSLGFSIVALVNSEVKAQVNAMYALTRSTALARSFSDNNDNSTVIRCRYRRKNT
jgi:hypothetical protein